MQQFSTNAMPSGQRVQFWNELCGRLYNPIHIDPVDQLSFSGEMNLLYDGAFKVSHFSTTPVNMERTRQDTRNATSTSLTVFLRLQGSATFTISDERLKMTPGNIMLFDAHTPFQFAAEEATSALAIGIPDNFVAAHIPNVDRAVGRLLDDTVPLYPIIVATVKQIGAQTRSGTAPSPKLLRALLELISASVEDSDPVNETPGASEHAQRWRRRASSLIASNLRDPDLTAGRIAASLGISPRYLRMIFAGQGENVTGYIRRLRLEESAKCLLNPGWKNVPLAEVAAHWGFDDPAYFSRCFRASFGVPPSQYRPAARH